MTTRLLVDVDGTLGRQVKHTLDTASAHGISHDASLADIDQWNAPVPGSDYDIGELIVKLEAEYPKEYVLNMPVVSGARKALSFFYHHGYEVTICTHRSADCHNLTAQWLEQNNIPYSSYVFDVPENKTEIEADVLIDDYHKNIRDAVATDTRGVLFTSPYSDSESIERLDGATTVNTWGEALSAIATMQKNTGQKVKP